jgi:hypothetical protein
MSAFILGDPYEVHWPFLLTVFLVLLLDWLISAWLLYRIGKRLRYEKSWNAWFPLYNTWMLIKLALKRHPAIWLASLLLLNFCMSFARLCSVAGLPGLGYSYHHLPLDKSLQTLWKTRMVGHLVDHSSY